MLAVQRICVLQPCKQVGRWHTVVLSGPHDDDRLALLRFGPSARQPDLYPCHDEVDPRYHDEDQQYLEYQADDLAKKDESRNRRNGSCHVAARSSWSLGESSSSGCRAES